MKKKIKIIIIISIIIVVLLAILGIYLFKSGNLIYGKWTCNQDITVVFNKDKTFEFYSLDKNTLDINGTFTIDDKTIDTNKVKYNLTLKSDNRVISGQKLTDSYSTKYEITMETTNNKEFAMINLATYSIYTCKKNK